MDCVRQTGRIIGKCGQSDGKMHVGEGWVVVGAWSRYSPYTSIACTCVITNKRQFAEAVGGYGGRILGQSIDAAVDLVLISDHQQFLAIGVSDLS